MKRWTATVLVAMLVVPSIAPTVALAHTKGTSWSHRILHDFYSVRREISVRAAGRDIIRRGVLVHGKARPATKKEKGQFQRNLRKLLNPPALMVTRAVPPRLPPAGTASGFSVAALPSCTWVPESGGNYNAVNGQYWGKYQIALSHWNTVCRGMGKDPAGQEQCAVAVYRSEGLGAWVNC